MGNETFISLVKQRVSCRAYDPKPVPREHLELMLEAARVAPSACNKQPWRFAVVQDETARMRLVNESFRFGLDMKWAANAGAIIALGVRRKGIVHKVGTKISGVEYPQIDLGIAGEHLVLQAEELGLGTCWIGWINQKAVRNIVGWSKEIDPMGLITVGWPASSERKTRPRYAMDEIATWI
ncbi:MAG: nitroreductase family protein [Kiritimatiellaceae bacterium]|nr:nitroreductase family protein [Kiritimatiellaceae bacterium]